MQLYNKVVGRRVHRRGPVDGLKDLDMVFENG